MKDQRARAILQEMRDQDFEPSDPFYVAAYRTPDGGTTWKLAAAGGVTPQDAIDSFYTAAQLYGPSIDREIRAYLISTKTEKILVVKLAPSSVVDPDMTDSRIHEFT